MTEISLSAMDYDRFGVMTAKCFVRSVSDITNIEKWCKDRDVQLVIARCSSDDTRIAQQLEDYGHRLMDTLVYFRKKFDNSTPPTISVPATYTVRHDIRPSAREMAAVAALSFKGYRGHYHSDDRINALDADAVYVSWAERSAQSFQVADQIVSIWCASDKGQDMLVAFATLKDSGSSCEGVLFGVHPEHQGMGLHRVLVRASLVASQSRGFDEFFSSTQLNNLQVQRNWAREGLLPSHSFYTFHQWRVQ